MPQVDDFDNFIINGEVGVEADLTPKLSMRSRWQMVKDILGTLRSVTCPRCGLCPR
jgi:hypothetical protein